MSDRILVVEDNLSVSVALVHLLRRQNKQVDTAKSLAELKQVLKEKHKYLAAIVDYNLPDARDGEAIDEVIEEGIPAIAFTGMTDNEVREDILRRAVIDYVPKESAQAYFYLAKTIERLKSNRSIRLLVVDDDRMARNYMVRLLKRYNFKITQATDGVEALKQLTRYPDIRMVLTDQNMPNMDGVSLTNEIRRSKGMDELAIIGVSSESNSSLSARFIKGGANDFIVKPYCHEELFCRININIDYLDQVAEIRHRANTDFLTQMFNRRYFFEQAPNLIKQAEQENQPLSVAMLDIDFFKRINDTYGHDAGDLAIQMAANAIKDSFDESLSARFGGEEFCVVLPNTDLALAKQLLDEFRAKIEDMSFEWEQNDVRYTMSIGVTSLDGNDIAELVNLADNNLYAAKEGGRNKVVGN